MTDIAIRVENLGKRYRLGQQVGYKTLRESLTNAVSAPFRRPRQTGDRRQETETTGLRSPVLGPQSSVPSLPKSGPPSPVSSPSNYIWALKDVSFEVKQGEAVGIIGRNGSGKSTLLKILSRITAPTEGYAEIRGRVGSLLEVGTGFHPELTGRENIYLNGAVLGMKKVEVARKFDDIVAFAEIEKFLDTPVKRYSSGMYVRLAFAVAAHLEPDILVVDEVLAVGDAQFQKKCLGKMGEVAERGRTVLFVSHNMAAVSQLCERALLLTDGHILDDGPSREVTLNYLSSASKSSEGDIDISHPSLRRNSLADSRFRWTRITIVNSKHEPTSLIALGEPFELILQGIAESDLKDVRLGFAITSVLGVPIFNSFQIDSGISDQLPAGEVRFRVRIDPNLLAPGLYELSLGANGDGVVDWLPVAIQLTVTTLGAGRRDVWREHDGGVIRYPCNWLME